MRSGVPRPARSTAGNQNRLRKSTEELVSDEPGFRPDYRDVLAYVRISEAIRKLVGADGFNPADALSRPGVQSDDAFNPLAQSFADDLAEFIALADKLIQPPRPATDDGEGSRDGARASARDEGALGSRD
jgi:hypothetical protein